MQALKALLCWLYLTRLVFEDNLSTQYCISTLKSFSESFTGATECVCVQQNTLLPRFIPWAAWICNYKDNLSVSGELEWMTHTLQHKGQAVERKRERIEVTESLDNEQWWSLTRQDHHTQLATRKTDVTLFLPYAQTNCPTGHFQRVQCHHLRFRQVFRHTYSHREIYAYASYLNGWIGKTGYILRKRTHEEREIFQKNSAR